MSTAMKTSEVSRRYAKSLFELSQEAGAVEKTLGELRELSKAYGDESIQAFMGSRVVSAKDKLSVIEGLTKSFDFSETTRNFLKTLASKGRLSCIPEIASSFESCADEKNEVVRGTVRSTHVLSPDEKAEIEKTIQQVIKKKVIITYTEEENIIGGIEAQVGGYTFDDSLLTHLNKLKEELKRSVH